MVGFLLRSFLNDIVITYFLDVSLLNAIDLLYDLVGLQIVVVQFLLRYGTAVGPIVTSRPGKLFAKLLAIFLKLIHLSKIVCMIHISLVHGKVVSLRQTTWLENNVRIVIKLAILILVFNPIVGGAVSLIREVRRFDWFLVIILWKVPPTCTLVRRVLLGTHVLMQIMNLIRELHHISRTSNAMRRPWYCSWNTPIHYWCWYSSCRYPTYHRASMWENITTNWVLQNVLILISIPGLLIESLINSLHF